MLDECSKFAKEIGGEIILSNDNFCAVLRMRNIEITIQDHQSKSPLVLAGMFSYEKNVESEDGDSLCLCQFPVTENEINLIVPILKSLDFKIDSLNNRWIKANPPIYYVNAHVIDDPTIFAINVSHIFRLLNL